MQMMPKFGFRGITWETVMVMVTVTASEMATAMAMESNNSEIVFWGQVAATTAMEWCE